MITGQQTKAVYLANGTQTEFPLPFFFFDQGDVVVSTVDQYGVEAQITTGYAVAGAQDEDGGTVTFAAPPTAGLKLVLRRRTARKQETRYPEGGKFPSRTVETDFDKLVAIAQELTEEVARCVQTPPDDSIDRNELVQELLAARGAAAVSAEEAATSAAAAQGQANRAESEADAAAAARVAAESVADGVAQAVADARQDVLASAAFVPIGGIMDFPVNTVPAGYLICAGQTITKAAYPELVAYLTGDPMALAAVVPDYRGTVSRAADLGRGLATDVVVGGYLDDAFQGHTHNGDYKRGWNNGGVPKYAPYYSNTVTHTDSYVPDVVAPDGVNGAPRTASETRGKSYGVVRCIKA
ncbi:MAG TPA: tail fiber protein, partial [Nitratidesulfovibrio sp.]|nr:tail fiber protein [Nitratidesulfovibrio sp.]